MGMKIQPAGHAARLQRWGYFFVLPFIVIYAVFHLYPIFNTFFLAFMRDEGAGVRPVFAFAGLENFSRLLWRACEETGARGDAQFWGALQNTFIIWGWNFVPQIGLALLLSIWLSDSRLNLKLRAPFRAIIYLPNLLTAASVAMLFRSIFEFPQGPMNQFLIQVLGVTTEEIHFFRSVPISRGVVSFIQFWMWYGHTVILLMAGITSISATYFEAARIDGAGSWQTTWRITLPLLRPIILFVLVTSMIGGMQMLEIPLLLTGDLLGGPNFSTRTSMVYVYNVGFDGMFDKAYAAAISVGIFAITFIMAVVIFFFLRDRSDLGKNRSSY